MTLFEWIEALAIVAVQAALPAGLATEAIKAVAPDGLELRLGRGRFNRAVRAISGLAGGVAGFALAGPHTAATAGAGLPIVSAVYAGIAGGLLSSGVYAGAAAMVKKWRR